MPMPLGLEFGSLSGIVGSPVASEKRTVTGVDARVACGARVSVAASAEGANVPSHMSPLAWAGRKPGWTPCSLSNASSNCCARLSLANVPVGMRLALSFSVVDVFMAFSLLIQRFGYYLDSHVISLSKTP